MNTVKKTSGFWKGLLIYVIVMVVLILVGLAVFWCYIAAYEHSRPEGMVEDYLETRFPEELDSQITQYAEANATDYESAESIETALREALEGGDVTYRKTPGEYSQETPVYTIRSDKQEIARVELDPVDAGILSFGFNGWECAEITFALENFAQTHTITAPADAQVMVNGAVLTNEYLTGDGIYPELEPYVEDLKTIPDTVTYSIDLFTQPEITATDAMGSTYLLEMDDTGAVSLMMAFPEDLERQLKSYADSFVRAYIAFTSNAAEGPEEVQSYMIPGSSLYRRMNAAMDGLGWVQGVTSTMKDLTLDHFWYYGTVVLCDAHYGLSAGTGDTENNMRIVLTETDYGWRVATIKMF